MVNEQHLEILRQGREELGIWNKWRKDNPDEKPELGHADLGMQTSLG